MGGVVFGQGNGVGPGGVEILWNRTYHEAFLDYIAQASNASYLILGRHTDRYETGKIHLLTINDQGNVLWNRTYRTYEDELRHTIQSITMTGDGDYMVAGGLGVSIPGVGVVSHAYLARIGADGDEIWARTYHRHSCATDLAPTTDGGYIIVGYIDSLEGTNTDVYILKTDGEGNLVWENSYGTADYDRATGVVPITDGCVVAGYTGIGSREAFYVLKVDDEGNMMWNYTYSTGRRAFSITSSGDDGFVIAGYSRAEGPEGSEEVHIVRIDDQGRELWERSLGGTSANKILRCPEGGYIILGEGSSVGGRYGSSKDLYILRVDSWGTPSWNTTYGGEEWDWAGDIVPDGEDGYVIVGYTTVFNDSSFQNSFILRIRDESIMPVAEARPSRFVISALLLLFLTRGAMIAGGATCCSLTGLRSRPDTGVNA
jgi:hypothetical protein